MTEHWDGLVLVDKPAGPTSHDIVARVRRALGGIKVGHTGTLDPPATGLLVLVLGRATRLARFLPSEPKVYTGVFELGLRTTTDDVTGEVVGRHEGEFPSNRDVVAAATRLVGRQLQVPPMVSARHVGGKRLYDLARQGKSVVAPPSEVVVERFDIAAADTPRQWTYEFEVSAGTYVRAAVRDLGDALGCGATVLSLRRTRIGLLRIDDAARCSANRDELRAALAEKLVAIDSMPLALAEVTLDDDAMLRRFIGGAAVAWTREASAGGAELAVRATSGALLGIGTVEGGSLRPNVVIPPRGIDT